MRFKAGKHFLSYGAGSIEDNKGRSRKKVATGMQESSSRSSFKHFLVIVIRFCSGRVRIR